HAHRHRHEAEGDRAAPDCTRHRAVDTRVSIRPNTATTRVTRGVDIPQKASPPSGGVDSWGRLRRPQVVPRPGKRLWILWRGRLHACRESAYSYVKPLPTVDGRQLAQAKTPSERNLALRLRFSSSDGTGSRSSSASRSADPRRR